MKIYEDITTEFNNNGLGVLNEPLSIQIKREINGIWSLECDYSNDGHNSKLIKENRIIKANTPSGPRLFRIRDIEKSGTINITIHFYATVLFFDLADNLNFNTVISGSRKKAIETILANTMTKNNFKYVGEDSNDTSAIYTINAITPVNAIFGDGDSCIQKEYGYTEIDINDFEISSSDEIGKDSNILIAYDKNMTGITETLSFDDVGTRIVPRGANDLFLPEIAVDAPNINKFYQPFIRVVDFNDIGIVEPTEDNPGISREQAIKMLRDATNKLIKDTKIDVPFFNYNIKFKDLGNTIEYNQFKSLYKLDIGDKVKIKHKPLDIEMQGRIIAYTWDGVSNEYTDIQLGMIKKDLSMTIDKITAQIQFTEQKLLIDLKNTQAGLETKIEIEAGLLRSEITDVNNNLNTKIEQTASDIRLEASNTEKKLQASININAEAIEQRVSNNEFTSYKKQTANEISQKVSKGNEFSSEMKQNVNAFQFLFNEAGDNKTTIDRSGITITEGGLTVEDSKGNKVLYFNSSGQCFVKYLGATDLFVNDTSEGSTFYNMLYNMSKANFKNLNATKFYVSGQHIYDYIVDVLIDKGLL